MSIMYKPVLDGKKILRSAQNDNEDAGGAVLQSNAKSGGEDSSAAPQNDRGAAGKSEYQRAREHFSAFFAEKTAEELETQRKRLAYAQAAIGDLRSPCRWLAHQSAVYFWAMAQSIELGEAQRRLREKQRQEKQAAQQLRF